VTVVRSGLHDHEDLIEAADAVHSRIGAARRQLFSLILEIDLTGAWEDSGARDLAHWLGMRYGISYWKASRWIGAAHALEELPLIARAFAQGELSTDKVVELARFATPETESRLIRWGPGGDGRGHPAQGGSGEDLAAGGQGGPAVPEA